ncbi:MAG: hypothetical protein PVF10_12290 [Syntrophobacterales bacterium]|jgi:hypothetical protein
MSRTHEYFIILLLSLFSYCPTESFATRGFVKLAASNIVELGDGSHPERGDSKS